jgi:Ni/Fe-hydrogenase subunit HybB-like protein
VAHYLIAGIVINRFSTSWFAMAPVDGVRYSPSWMEVAILAGVASGVLLVFTLVTRFFPVFKETVRVGAPETQPAPASALQPTAAAPATARGEAA